MFGISETILFPWFFIQDIFRIAIHFTIVRFYISISISNIKVNPYDEIFPSNVKYVFYMSGKGKYRESDQVFF